MAAYDSLKSLVQQAIRTNGNNEITGQVLQNVLMAMIDELGGENGYAGVATPSTNPGAPDGKVFYFATEAGTYTHFDGATLAKGIHLLVFNGVTWSHQTLYTIDSEVTSGSNNLITSGAVYTKIINAINALDATVSKSAGADGLSLSLTETDGKVTSISGSIASQTYDAYGAASAAQIAAATDATNKVNAAKTQILGDAASDYNTLGKLEDKIQAEASRAAAAESALNTAKADKATTLAGYGINDAYTKTEVNGLVSTPHQNYVTVPTYASLPATGSADTIYRVSNYNGSTSQVDASVYSEYAWNGSGYIFLRVVSQIGEVFDITVYNSNTKYADLAAALGTNGANVPSSIRRGGMSVKFVRSSDNKYVQYRYMGTATTGSPNPFTDTANWQGVDDEPTAGSENLVKSGGVAEKCALVETKSNDSFDITDSEGNIVVRFNGGIKTKDFDSTFEATQLKRGMMSSNDKIKLNGIEEGAEKNNMGLSDGDGDLSFSDDNHNVLAEFYDGHIKTKNFDSKKTNEKIEKLISGDYLELYAYADGDSTNDDSTHFYGWKNHICAWQRAINACDGVTRTKIYCYGGIKVTNVADMFKYGNFWNVINIPNGKNNIELIGQGVNKTRVEVSLPSNLDISSYQYYQTMYINGNNCVIKDMTIALKNGRYPLHLDKSGGDTMNGYNVTFENCEFIHYMNDLSGMWSNAPFGLGISSGMHLITKRCGFVAPTRPLYLHDNINHNEGFLWDIIDCYCNNFATIDALKGVFTIQMLGGGCDGVINVINMDCGSTPELYVMDQLNNSVTAGKPKESYVANLFTRITGQSFNPVGYYVNNVDVNGNLKDDSLNYPNAGVLRFKSSTAGNSSTVRFNKTSSAFDVLIKGQNLATDFTIPQSPIVYADNYVYRDGKTSALLSTNGYAHGCLAIAKNSDVASLHARLGDCSVNNISLGVIIDGTEQTIIFNQNYSSMSDADIIDAINSQLSGAVADIFIWGAEYYPEIKPSFHILTNKVKGVIPNGSVVSFKNNTLDLATRDDEIFGVAIDDIYYNNDGRVLTKCLLSTSANDRFHINVTLTEGAYRYGIDSNAGVLVAKADGIFTADYNGFLTLNK